MRYRIHFTNFGYFAEATFTSAEEALDHGRARCFEFSVCLGSEVVLSWSPIRGTTHYCTGGL